MAFGLKIPTLCFSLDALYRLGEHLFPVKCAIKGWDYHTTLRALWFPLTHGINPPAYEFSCVKGKLKTPPHAQVNHRQMYQCYCKDLNKRQGKYHIEWILRQKRLQAGIFHVIAFGWSIIQSPTWFTVSILGEILSFMRFICFIFFFPVAQTRYIKHMEWILNEFVFCRFRESHLKWYHKSKRNAHYSPDSDEGQEAGAVRLRWE